MEIDLQKLNGKAQPGIEKNEGKSREKRKSRKQLIRDLLSAIENGFKGKATKVTLADFIRLIQLERELEEREQPREIIITWSEPREKRNAGK